MCIRSARSVTEQERYALYPHRACIAADKKTQLRWLQWCCMLSQTKPNLMVISPRWCHHLYYGRIDSRWWIQFGKKKEGGSLIWGAQEDFWEKMILWAVKRSEQVVWLQGETELAAPTRWSGHKGLSSAGGEHISLKICRAEGAISNCFNAIRNS